MEPGLAAHRKKTGFFFFFLSVMETGQVAESKGEPPRMWERRKNSYVGTEGEVSLGFSWCLPNGPELFNKSDLCSWPHAGFCWAFKAISTNIYATFSNLQSVFRDIMSSSGQGNAQKGIRLSQDPKGKEPIPPRDWNLNSKPGSSRFSPVAFINTQLCLPLRNR